MALVLHFAVPGNALFSNFSQVAETRQAFRNQQQKGIFMEELFLLERQADISPSEIVALLAATAMSEEADEMNLLEVMEFCSDVCLAHPLCLLQIVHCIENSSEICIAPLMAEIMQLKLSPFGFF